MSLVKKSFQFGEHNVTLETGEIARQATGAVMVNMDETVVLVTVVGNKKAMEGRDFFPLTVDYQERTYSAGRIPGGFFRREGRPSENETLVSRLIDRPIRPLFPKGFTNEVQVVATVLSLNPEVDPDIPSLIGTSAALSISGLPFNGPIGAARVGYIDGNYVLNPTHSQLEESQLDLVVAGTANAVLMVESEARELPEETMLGAVMYGHEQFQAAINAINELKAEAGKPVWELPELAADTSVADAVAAAGREALTEAYQIAEKMDRYSRLDSVREEIVQKLCGEGADPAFDEAAVQSAIEKLEKRIVRDRILAGEKRIDGRDTKTVRPITIRTGVLPRVHGSALFTRGETQALVVTTLGTARDAQIIDAIQGERREHFMLHYNFPPYCVGETGRVGSPKRREIGHGRLAKRGVAAVMPPQESFPYSIRVVSEITESNGSSSMASVCGSSLAMMDAGVPIKAPVAGVAMGLVKEGNKYAVLTDILGDEDHLGDMDFKVAGTAKGVTALQMDIKIAGITDEIMEVALNQAHEARIHILGEMAKVIEKSRDTVSENAPSMKVIMVPQDKIRDVIGKGGATIRSIVEETGADIDIEDDGSVRIYADSAESMEAAVAKIQEITAEAEVGRIYHGRVERIVDFGAFVNILPGKDGLLHISQIADERVEQVTDYLQEGQMVDVVVLDVDQRGRIKLSMKEVPNYAESA